MKFDRRTGDRTFWLRRSRRSIAFTLVEVMIAMGILGMIMVAIYSCWSAILRGAKAGVNAAADVQRMRIAMRTVEQAFWGVKMFVQNSGYYAFLVDTNSAQSGVSFVSFLPESFPRSGRYTNNPVRRVSFAVEEGSDRVSRLVLHQRPLLAEPDRDEEENPVVLARDVTLFDLQFWGQNSRDWESGWLPTNQLPKLVKITLGFGRMSWGSRQPRDLAVRIISLPATAVPQEWQRPLGVGNRGGTNQPPRGGAGVSTGVETRPKQ